MRHRLDIWIFSATIILALCLAAPAKAANTGKHKKPVAGATAHAMKHRRTTAVVQPRYRYQGGVPAGPLYNGQDYLGNDPDPNIRSQILRDLGGRYGGND
jgi:hypothetical protein